MSITELTLQGHALHLTNLEKIYWPKEHYTKSDLINYYHEISSYILPYLKNRPVMLHRYPNGIEQEGFFQKNFGKDIPDWIKTTEISHENHNIHYILIQNEATLLYVINLGCIEIHPFHSRITDANYPDFLILDLDPEDISFDFVIETALVIHKILDDVKIKNFCKTSGGRGLHVYIPLGKQFDYEQAKAIASSLALWTHQELPEFTSLERNPAKRQKKIFLDFLRNNWTQTVIAPYSLRAKLHAPVATPLSWDEVKPGLNPLEFNIKTIPDRLKEVGDLFKPVLGKNGGKGLKDLLKNSF